MMRCGKLKTGSLFSRRLKFWFYGGVSLILADFGISMAHAQRRDSHVPAFSSMLIGQTVLSKNAATLPIFTSMAAITTN